MTATMPERVQTYWQGEPVPPVYRPHIVSGFGEGEQPTRAVIRVQMCLTRDELLWALNERCALADDFDLDSTPVEAVRAEVEMYAAGVGDFELSRSAEHFWRGFEDWTDQEKANVAAMVRAIDRAYPEYGSGIVVDGTPRDPQVRCTRGRCGWSADGDQVETLMNTGLIHAELHGEGR